MFSWRKYPYLIALDDQVMGSSCTFRSAIDFILLHGGSGTWRVYLGQDEEFCGTTENASWLLVPQEEEDVSHVEQMPFAEEFPIPVVLPFPRGGLEDLPPGMRRAGT